MDKSQVIVPDNFKDSILGPSFNILELIDMLEQEEEHERMKEIIQSLQDTVTELRNAIEKIEQVIDKLSQPALA